MNCAKILTPNNFTTASHRRGVLPLCKRSNSCCQCLQRGTYIYATFKFGNACKTEYKDTYVFHMHAKIHHWQTVHTVHYHMMMPYIKKTGMLAKRIPHRLTLHMLLLIVDRIQWDVVSNKLFKVTNSTLDKLVTTWYLLGVTCLFTSPSGCGQLKGYVLVAL